MSSIQQYLARATQKAADDLVKAYLNLPEDKRTWIVMGDARSAIDQVAECAMLNGSMAKLAVSRTWPTEYNFDDYKREKADLATDWNNVKALLDTNTAKAIAAIKATPDADLDIEIPMPWGPITVAQMIGYPFWNMCYHEGQINQIALMLGCLK